MKTIAKPKKLKVVLGVGLGLAMVAGLIAFFVVGQHQNNTADVVSENRLSVSLARSINPSSLQADISKVQQAVHQESVDVALAGKGLQGRLVLSANGQQLKGSQAFIRLMDMQLTAALELQSAAAAQLESQVNSLKGNISELRSLLPRIGLIKAADDQQTAETMLNSLSSKMQFAISAAGKQGVAITDLQADMTTYKGDVSAARNISGPIESSLAQTPPNPKSLRQDEQSTRTAEADIGAAITAAEAIINILKY